MFWATFWAIFSRTHLVTLATIREPHNDGEKRRLPWHETEKETQPLEIIFCNGTLGTWVNYVMFSSAFKPKSYISISTVSVKPHLEVSYVRSIIDRAYQNWELTFLYPFLFWSENVYICIHRRLN
jgi:hypothetical protein